MISTEWLGSAVAVLWQDKNTRGIGSLVGTYALAMGCTRTKALAMRNFYIDWNGEPKCL